MTAPQSVGELRAAEGWRQRLRESVVPLLLLVAVFGTFAATAERQGVGTDAYAASAEAWRLSTTGQPWFDGVDLTEVKGVHNKIELGRWILPAPNGHVVAQRMAGPVLAALPFYWLLADDPTPSAFTLGPGSLAAAAWTAGAVVLMFLALRRRLSTPLALAVALCFGFATPTWAVSANGVWTHTVTQFALAGAAYALARDKPWAAGIFFAVGMLARPHLALIAAVVGIGLGLTQRRPKLVVAIAVPTLLALAVLSVWNHWMFGTWSLTGAGYAGKISSAATGYSGSSEYDVSGSGLVNALGFLVSPARGLLVWTPVLALFVPAVVRARRRLPGWSVALAIGGVIYTAFQLRVNYFSGGVGFYSYRYGLELVTCLVPLIAFSLRDMGRVARLLAPPVVALQVAAIAIGALLEAYFLPVQQMWHDNSFWVALRYQPSVVGVGTGMCLLVGGLVSVMIARSPGEPVPDYAGKAPGTSGAERT